MDQRQEIGLLPVFGIATFAVFYFMWAAMHDIAHGESDPTLEYAVLALSLPAFAILYAAATKFMERGVKITWLSGTGLLVLLFNLGGIDAWIRPKYPLDPMLAKMFLAAGIPVLLLMAGHIAIEVRRLRATHA